MEAPNVSNCTQWGGGLLHGGGVTEEKMAARRRGRSKDLQRLNNRELIECCRLDCAGMMFVVYLHLIRDVFALRRLGLFRSHQTCTLRANKTALMDGADFPVRIADGTRGLHQRQPARLSTTPCVCALHALERENKVRDGLHHIYHFIYLHGGQKKLFIYVILSIKYIGRLILCVDNT